jgi:hypothetical protein
MSKPTCHDCVYSHFDPAGWLRSLSSGWPSFPLCANHPDCPGVLRPVVPGQTCRNFRAKRKPPVRIEPPEPQSDDVRHIALTRGQYAIVDAADFERLNKYRWNACRNGEGSYYARRYTKNGTILMHREIMKTPPGKVVDHIDRNGLNNRQANMRNCTPQQNEYNKRPRGGKSRFKGVYPHRDKWQAMMKHKGKLYHLGLFDDETEAAKARDRKALELEGEFAYLNFPEIRHENRTTQEPQRACPTKPPAKQGERKTDDGGLKTEDGGQEMDGT